MAYAGHVLREIVASMLCWYWKAVRGVRTRGPRAWIDDIKEWENVKDYSELKRNALTGYTGRTWHIYLLHKKKIHEEK